MTPRRPLLPRPLLPACLLLLAPVQAADPLPRVEVSWDTAGDSTRLVLTHSRPVAYAIQAGRNRLRVVYAEPVEVDPLERDIGDPILERYRLQGENTLLLHTGRAYRAYEVFELRHPFRLVLDLQGGGEEPRVARDPRSRRAAPSTIVVVDPGHGGIEHGAAGPTGLLEKDVTLALALRLRQILQDKHPSISVVLTRDDDRLLGLDERTAVANHNRADLFLSIHLNAAQRPEAAGAETYYLSTDAIDEEARLVAALENRSAGDDPAKAKRPLDDLDLVLWDLAQTHHLAESSALAESLQRHLNDLTGTRNRGVRQAPFRVLMGAAMPAILVEVGFISNPAEEAQFRTPLHQQRVAQAMAAAVDEFLATLDRLSPAPPAAGTLGP
jgi:N-acetylmuramoyl-L-alanine amidase